MRHVERRKHHSKTGAERLELPTAGFGDRCSTKLSYTPLCGPESIEPQPKRQDTGQPATYQGPRNYLNCGFRWVWRPAYTRCGNFANYSMILVTTPDPTVRPPSRMANRRFSCIATGEINST
jgi:hypothetical protein